MSVRGSLRAAVAACVPALLVLAALPFAARTLDVHVSFFTRDVFSVGGLPVYAGALSNLGVFLWCGTAAVCIFAAIVVRSADRGAARFLLVAGAFTALLMLDDFFMLHEWVFPVALDIPEDIIPLTYAAIGVAWIVAFRRRVLAGEPALLALALALLGASEVLDLLEPEHAPGDAPAWRYLTEEGLKFLGLVTWGTWLARESARSVRALRAAERRAQ